MFESLFALGLVGVTVAVLFVIGSAG
jgi:hypothetical protein